MTNTAHPIPPQTWPQTRFYDQTLHQLELGRTHNAIQSLAGIFDGVIAADGNAAKWRESLLAHPLFDVLSRLEARGDPAIAELGTNQAAASRQMLTDRARSGESKDVSADQLFAVDTPDLLDAAALTDELTSLRGQASPGSRIFISSFVPGHLGLGWRRIFSGKHIHCHDERALEVAASAAGFAIQHFRDASDCLIWAILGRPKPPYS